MSDQLFKTPRNVNTNFVANESTKTITSLGSHLSANVIQTPPEDNVQDIGVRRSPRNVGKDSAVKKFKMTSQKAYPGSGTKQNVRRSLRTPVQTIPLKCVDGKAEQSASKSFAVMSYQEDTVTPRSNIEAFLVVAESQPQTVITATDVSQRAAAAAESSVNKIHKTSKELGHVAPQRTSSAFDVSTPGSKLTPRSNIWNILHNEKNQAQTPTVRTDAQSGHTSARNDVSAAQHREYGQEVALSPLYLSHASEGRESWSPPKQSTKWTRRSFHIPTPQTTVTVSQDTGEQKLFEERQIIAQPDDFDSANADLESVPASVLSEKINAQTSSEITRRSASDIAEDVPNVTEKKRQTISTAADGNISSDAQENAHELRMEEEGEKNNLAANEEKGIDSAEATATNESIIKQNSLVMSRSSRLEVTVAVLNTADDLIMTGHTAQDESGQDVVEKGLVSAVGTSGTDVDADIAEDIITSALDVENMKTNAGLAQEEWRKDKNLGGSRTSVTSKHGEISFSTTPKKSPAKTQVTAAHSTRVYDLSEESSSSGDIHFFRQRMSSLSPRKGSRNSSFSAQKKKYLAKKQKSATTASRQNIVLGCMSSSDKSKLSYSKWKSLQKGKDSSGETLHSFLGIQPRHSSTPADRTKRIFHSTKLQNSVSSHAFQDQISGTLTVDTVSDISPIRPEVRRQKGEGSSREMIDLDADKENGDGPEDNIGHRESGVINQRGHEMELDMESDDDLRGSGQKRNNKMAETGQQQTKRKKKNTSSTALPRKSVKFFAERHSTMKLSTDAVEEIEKASELFWENTFKTLEAYAVHAGRKIINEQDVILLMETQRLVKDTEDLYDRIREFLPMELRTELIPIAKP